MTAQVKWLNDGRFRRFELIQLNFSALILELQKRVPTFHGSICYIDDQNDKIVIESDQDLLDALGYFRQLGENVMRIQSDQQQQPSRSKYEAEGNGQGKAAERAAVGESESADEASPKEAQQQQDGTEIKRSKNVACSNNNTALDKVELADFVEEEEVAEVWANFGGHHSSESVQSPSFLGIGGDFSHFDEASVEQMNGISVENANDLSTQRKKRASRSGVIPCRDCGMLVANASTSLKSHVNLHHLKLPIYKCRLCTQTSTQLQKASIVRHIERDHPGGNCEEFDYNYPALSRRIHLKLAECFPVRNAEMGLQF